MLSDRAAQATTGSPIVTRVGTGLRDAAGTIPPPGLVLLAIGSYQLGAAIAKGLFATLGPGGAVFLRVGFAAIVLLALGRPRLRGHDRPACTAAILFGLALAGMNFAFFAALDRIPLGTAVTLEFVGPLGVAIVGSRRRLDLLWVVLATAGLAALAPWGGSGLDPVGVALALFAGCFWAGYILLGVRVGRVFERGTGLALAMGVAAIVLTPVGIISGGMNILHPKLLVAGLGVALLSSVVPYSLELEALRRMPASVFAILLSSDPAIAALVGFLALGETLGLRALGAIAFVTAAAVGSARYGARFPGG